jgi:serine/threonine protein kinase
VGRPKTEQALERLAGAHGDEGTAALEAILGILVGAREGWSDDHLAELVAAIDGRLKAGQPLDPAQLERWMRAHAEPDHHPRVKLCVALEPPSYVEVLEVLSLAGAQKVVFKCHWLESESEIVLKQFLDAEQANALLKREQQPHPFSMEHPNIIETHFLANRWGEEFLLERFIEALDDARRAEGAYEAANLLHDIASALQFVHDRGKVHGDVKPDNTGYDRGRYLLLDFGIARPAVEFDDLDSATGSLRTRAPELIIRERRHSSKSDVWALGATVFNFLLGRFPLFRPEGDEGMPPSADEVAARAEFEAELRKRVQNEYEQLTIEPLRTIRHKPLRQVLALALAKDPDERKEAATIAALCRSRIAGQVRASKASALSARARLEQLERFLRAEQVKLLPPRRRRNLRAELRDLAPNLNDEERKTLAVVEARLDAAA